MGVATEEGAEAVQEGEELRWGGRVRGVEQWGEEGGDDDAVDLGGWGV